ncbi:MAG: hypothetical protein EPGJADBJ_04271 [Saprospiraceae bacterium]|nr:hypothetical protein [Saprospiraceae bacterium]
MVPTLGAGFGIAFQAPQSKTSVFLQPVVRYISRDIREDRIINLGHHFLNPGIEFGIRNYF